jgi:hypothetical protein
MKSTLAITDILNVTKPQALERVDVTAIAARAPLK